MIKEKIQEKYLINYKKIFKTNRYWFLFKIKMFH